MRLKFGILSLLLACNESVIEKQDNSAPVIMIASHSPDAEILEGYVEPFRATVSDDDNEYSELSVAWYVGEEIVCDWTEVSPAGESYCDIVFNSDDNSVIAEVRDPQGAGGRSEIGVVIVPTEAPTAQILAPTQNSNHYSDQLIQFSGIVGDNEDNAEDLIVTWSSSLDGDLILDTVPDSNGNISDYGYLSEGQHALELRVEDTSGKVTREQLVLLVGEANSVPSCSIISPADSTATIIGDSLILRGTAADDNVLSNELSASWYSDKDGDLGTSTVTSDGETTFTINTLTANDHVLGLRVEDEVGAVCIDEILVFVGTAPIAVIEEPLSGDIFSLGDAILFHGTLNDAEDTITDLEVSWDSSNSGQIASGNPDSQGSHQFSVNDLDAGVHTVTLSGTDSTGLVGSDTITFRVNTPPTAPTVSLSPNPVYGDNILTAVAIGSTDDDGDTISYTYEWYENGTLYTSSLPTVPASELDVGEVWTVRVTPNDGYTDGAYAEANITVSNSTPTLTSPVITSATGSIYNDSIVSCSSTAVDVDEVVTATFSWDINGSIVTGNSVDLSNYSVNSGDSISCTASVSDSNGGSATSQSSILVDNRAPSISTISISPSSPNSQDQLTCSVTSSDADGDSLTESMEWFVAGSSVGITNILDLAVVGSSPGDTVECVAIVTDASGASDQQSTSVNVVNTDPTIDILTLLPNEPTLNDSLSCYAESSDIDGDTPTLSFSFTNQTTGSTFSPTTASTNVATLDISSTDADYEHILTCSVTATDVDGGSSFNSANVTVMNTAPVFDQVAMIIPSFVEIGTDVECTAIASDPDDGVASLTYVWQVNGAQVATGSTWTISSTDANVGDDLTCMALAVDYEGNSTTSTSAPAPISNTVPEVSGVLLNTQSPLTNDALTVSPSTFDFNGDAVTLNYEWHVIDASQGGQDIIVYGGNGTLFASLDGSQSYGFDKGDEVYVNVTPNDGVDNGITVESDHAMVENTAPSAALVTVTSTSNPPLEAVDDLTCTITSGSTDDDGDSIDYTYNWYDPNGVNTQILPNTNSLSDTFPGSSTTAGLWECEVIASDGTASTNSSADIDVDSDWAGALTFTNCGQTGLTGPSQSQCDSEYSGTTLDGIVTSTSGIQYWVVPSTGDYTIETHGAAGGLQLNDVNTRPGYGATMIGTFTLSGGTILKILVGQLGGDTVFCQSCAAGGGGGTFVTDDANTPFIIAGGGNGENWQNWDTDGPDALTTNTGTHGGNATGRGGGGGGFVSNGNDYSSQNYGKSFLNGGMGGIKATSNSGDGGFGGGGGSLYEGGGGGGYHGGSVVPINEYTSSYPSYGSGSYNIGSNQVNSSGVNTGHGYVVIDKL